jgi:hypothetical protein
MFCIIVKRRGVTYKTCFGLDDWINCTLYIHTLGTTGNYSDIVIVHTFQFTVAHALGTSVFTSRILAMDLSQSHCHFNSHMKSSWHSLIFHAISYQSPWTVIYNSTQFPSNYGSVLRCTLLLLTAPSCNSWTRIQQKTQPVLLTRLVYRIVA